MCDLSVAGTATVNGSAVTGDNMYGGNPSLTSDMVTVTYKVMAKDGEWETYQVQSVAKDSTATEPDEPKADADKKAIPQTGDSVPLAAGAVVALAALGAALAVIARRRLTT